MVSTARHDPRHSQVMVRNRSSQNLRGPIRPMSTNKWTMPDSQQHVLELCMRYCLGMGSEGAASAGGNRCDGGIFWFPRLSQAPIFLSWSELCCQSTRNYKPPSGQHRNGVQILEPHRQSELAARNRKREQASPSEGRKRPKLSGPRSWDRQSNLSGKRACRQYPIWYTTPNPCWAVPWLAAVDVECGHRKSGLSALQPIEMRDAHLRGPKVETVGAWEALGTQTDPKEGSWAEKPLGPA